MVINPLSPKGDKHLEHLPEDIRMQDNYNIFKGQLKTHYFRLAYNF